MMASLKNNLKAEMMINLKDKYPKANLRDNQNSNLKDNNLKAEMMDSLRCKEETTKANLQWKKVCHRCKEAVDTIKQRFLYMSTCVFYYLNQRSRPHPVNITENRFSLSN